MAYSPNTAANAILQYKKMWQDANAAGDEEGKNKAASGASSQYDSLKANGYTDMANKLWNSDYNAAKDYLDKYYATTGKTKTRPYFYDLGKSYGLTQSQVDALISYDDTTGNVSFGGKNIGTPDAVVDGTSYWGDTSVLDNAMSDYAKRTGLTQPYSQTAKTSAAKVREMIGDLYDTQKTDRSDVKGRYANLFDYANSDVTQSDEYKSAFANIMPSYNLAALQERDNAVASGSSANGGNIDSFSAANAMRQQAAMTAKGQQLAHQMGLESYNARISNAKGILSDMGVYLQNQDAGMLNTINAQQSESQRLFENSETEKNNQVDRDVKTSQVTGYVPTTMRYASNMYFNPDGTLKSTYQADAFDNTGGFQAIIDNANAQLENETDPSKIADLQETIRNATDARNYKIGNNEKYAQYANTITSTAPWPTEEKRQFNESIAAADRALDAEIDMNAANNQHEMDMYSAELQGEKELQEQQAAYNAASPSSSGTKSSGTKSSGGSSSGSSSTKDPLTDAQVKKWADLLNQNVSDTYGKDWKALKQVEPNRYERADIDADYIIVRVLNSDDLTQAQKDYLLYDKFGITKDQVNTVLKDNHYR